MVLYRLKKQRKIIVEKYSNKNSNYFIGLMLLFLPISRTKQSLDHHTQIIFNYTEYVIYSIEYTCIKFGHVYILLEKKDGKFLYF